MLELPTAPHLLNSETDEERFDLFETRKFLDHRIIVQEKLRGFSIACYFRSKGRARGRAIIRHNGNAVTYHPHRDGFRAWVKGKESIMAQAIAERLVIHGMWVKNVKDYVNPHDLFLVHDIFDLRNELFWSYPRIQQFCQILGMATVPILGEGIYGPDDLLEKAASQAKYGEVPVTELYLRYEDDIKVLGRAQLRRDA